MPAMLGHRGPSRSHVGCVEDEELPPQKGLPGGREARLVLHSTDPLLVHVPGPCVALAPAAASGVKGTGQPGKVFDASPASGCG